METFTSVSQELTEENLTKKANNMVNVLIGEADELSCRDMESGQQGLR